MTPPYPLESVTTEDKGESVSTEIEYLAVDPRYEHERPYELRYDARGAIPATNIINEWKPVAVRNFRAHENSNNLQEYGFRVALVNCPLTMSEYNEKSNVEELYYPALETILREQFPDAAVVKFLEHRLRERDDDFPETDKRYFKRTQPSTIAHMDFSVYSARRTAETKFNMSPDQYRRLVTVNLWKLLRKNGNDWPLALCDWRSIHRPTESVVCDIVYEQDYTENESVHYSPRHRWFYYKDLTENEVIMFQQTDSLVPNGGGVAHVSFRNPDADQTAMPRASIEVRAFVFFM